MPERIGNHAVAVTPELALQWRNDRGAGVERLSELGVYVGDGQVGRDTRAYTAAD